MKIKIRINVIFDRNGISVFSWKTHDEVLWLWPWKREGTKGRPFFSHSFNSTYRTLEELRVEWIEYNATIKKFNGGLERKVGEYVVQEKVSG